MLSAVPISRRVNDMDKLVNFSENGVSKLTMGSFHVALYGGRNGISSVVNSVEFVAQDNF